MSTTYIKTHIKPGSKTHSSVDVKSPEPLMDEVRNFVDGVSDEFWRTIESHFRRLTHRMLFGDSSLRRWEESDDIVQSSMLRLYACLKSVNVESDLHLLRLVALQIRRELDRQRVVHPYGPQVVWKRARFSSDLRFAAVAAQTSTVIVWDADQERAVRVFDNIKPFPDVALLTSRRTSHSPDFLLAGRQVVERWSDTHP